MARLKATLANTPTTFPAASAPVPHQYRFELSGPASEERIVSYNAAATSVEALFSVDPAPPGDYTVECELLNVAGARVGDMKTALHTVEAEPPPPNGKTEVKITYPAGKGLVFTLVEV